jgi:hypothetical protein
MNAITELTAASARAITRRLSAPVDLLALYAQLSDGGRRADTMLLETTAGKSIILDRAAVRIECRGRQVVLDALSNGGQAVLDFVRKSLADHVASAGTNRLTLQYDRSHDSPPTTRPSQRSPCAADAWMARSSSPKGAPRSMGWSMRTGSRLAASHSPV